MIQSQYLTFALLILTSFISLTSAQTSSNEARSTSVDKESNKQERIDIDLNKPYIPEHSSTAISSPSASFNGESVSRHSTKKTQQLLRDQGETIHLAYSDNNTKKRKIFGDERQFKPKVSLSSNERIRIARKNVREGKATEEDHFIVEKRKKIEQKSRKNHPETQKKIMQRETLQRERVRKGIATPHEVNKFRTRQAQDRLNHKKRYYRLKAKTSGLNSPK